MRFLNEVKAYIDKAKNVMLPDGRKDTKMEKIGILKLSPGSTKRIDYFLFYSKVE